MCAKYIIAIAFANRIATAGERLVIPPRDLGSGELIEYRLEPFLPFVTLANRNLPEEPTIQFDLPGGSLAVTVIAPSGRSEALGTHTIQQARTGQASSSGGILFDDGGGNPSGVYQLTTLSDDFAYQFREYGRYEIRLSGSVPDTRAPATRSTRSSTCGSPRRSTSKPPVSRTVRSRRR